MTSSTDLDVRITDTSLRNGSHAVAHQFTIDQVTTMVAGMDAAGVPVIEVAHGDGLGGSTLTPIVPFSAVGADDMFDVVADGRTPGVAQVSSLMKRLVGVPLPPVVAALGPTLVPRPERLYFRFGEAIDTTRFDGRHDDAVRDEVRAEVLAGIEELMALRETDPQRSLARRLLGRPDAEPHAFQAGVELDRDQITHIRVFLDRESHSSA